MEAFIAIDTIQEPQSNLGESGLVGYFITFRIKRILIQTPLYLSYGLGPNFIMRLLVTLRSSKYQMQLLTSG